MKKIIFLVGLMLFFSAMFVYGQEDTGTQETNMQTEEKIFSEPLEKRVEKAVSGMEEYGEEVYKDLESIENSDKKTETLFLKMKEYISNYVRDNSIRELLELEAQILKRGEGMDSIYGWFHAVVHNTVLKLAEYSPVSDIPISDKVLEIIQDKKIDDYVRSKYVIDIENRFTDLHNKRIEVDEKIKEKIYPTLIKIINDRNNDSKLRAEAAGTLASICEDNEKIAKYVVKILDDKDDLVKIRTIWLCSLKNDEIRKKVIDILANRHKYSEEVTERARMKIARYPDKTYDAIPYLLDMLHNTQDKEEFKNIAMNLQEYNDPLVMKPIIKKVKELGLEKDRDRYYLENSLLLDYLPQAKDEDKLLVLTLIYDTAYDVYGNVYTPPHFDKAINTLKNYILSPNKETQLVVLRTYDKIIESAKSTSIESAHKEGMSKLDDMREILLKNKNEVKEPEIVKQIDYLLNRIEKLNREQNQ